MKDLCFPRLTIRHLILKLKKNFESWTFRSWTRKRATVTCQGRAIVDSLVDLWIEFSCELIGRYMRLDAAAHRALNVMPTRLDANNSFSLYGLMSRGRTAMSKRKLKASRVVLQNGRYGLDCLLFRTSFRRSLSLLVRKDRRKGSV